MPKIHAVDRDGTEKVIEGEAGMSLMLNLRNVGGLDIAAICGGMCSCATCHVYVREDWLEKTGGPSEMEEDMLDFAFDVRDTSRLSCQIKVSDDLDGLVVTVPEKQF